MYIGCNWSESLKFLLEKDAVKVDYIKSGAWGTFNEDFAVMRSMRPILLHGLGYFEHTGMKNIETVDFNFANNLLKKCNSPHYGIHLAIENSDMYDGMTDEDVYRRMCNIIQTFMKNLDVPLLLENVPDSPQDRVVFDHYPYIMPEQYNRIFNENCVSFLLDLTHAKITAEYHGWDVHDYIRKLPLDRISEIHVNGSGFDKDGFPADTHESMKEEDYKLLQWVLCLSKPEIVTLEYSGKEWEDQSTVISSLEKQLNKIYNILQGISN
jgi:uncharacterized protein (UPF0276 family)